MSYLIRFQIIKQLINKPFPDIEPKYSFSPITKHFEVCFKQPNGVCILSILEDSTWVDIKKSKKLLHLLN